MRQFGAEHGSVLLLVVQFQTLKEVLVASLLLVFFALAEDGQEFVQLHFLLALLLRAAQLLDGGIRRVQVQRTKDVAKVNGVDDVGAVGIVNGEGEFRPFSREREREEKNNLFNFFVATSGVAEVRAPQ